MMTLSRSVVAVCCAAVVCFMAVSVVGQSANCLGCLCEASTSCNRTVGCSSFAGYHCGPFLITWAFWRDAGQPVLAGMDPNVKGSFEACANDIFCAADAVALYMKKFEQDCNGDGQVTCSDYGLIHKIGGYGCRVPAPPGSAFFKTFNECLQHINEL